MLRCCSAAADWCPPPSRKRPAAPPRSAPGRSTRPRPPCSTPAGSKPDRPRVDDTPPGFAAGAPLSAGNKEVKFFAFVFSYFVVLEIRSMSASWHFSQLGWNPCRMSNYLSQGRVSLHAKLLFVDIFFSANGKSLLEIIRSHWRTCCRSFRQTSKNFFCLIGAGRCWESKHQFGWFLCWPHRRRRGSASMGGMTFLTNIPTFKSNTSF